MTTDERSTVRQPLMPKLENWPQRIRRGSPLVSYLVERDRGARLPAWRWWLADRLVSRKRKAPPASIDPTFARVMQYRSLLDLDESNSKRIAFELKHPDLVEALQLFAEDGLQRWVLEARLLAGQSAEEIAQIEGLTFGVVNEYEAVFFNVTGRLGAPYWVVGRAIGPRYLERLEAGEVGVILKAFAHFCGPKMLDLLLHAAVDRSGDLIPLDISSLNTAEEVSVAMARFTIECLTGPADPKRYLELLGIRELIKDAQRRFSTKTEEAAPISSDLGLAARRYDVETESPDANSDLDRTAPEADLPLGVDVGRQTGGAEQDREVA